MKLDLSFKLLSYAMFMTNLNIYPTFPKPVTKLLNAQEILLPVILS